MARIDYRLELKAAGHGNDLDVRIRVSCCQQSSKRGGVAEVEMWLSRKKGRVATSQLSPE